MIVLRTPRFARLSLSLIGACLLSTACDGLAFEDDGAPAVGGAALSQASLAPAPLSAPVIVRDEAFLDWAFETRDGALAASLFRDGAWVPTSGGIADEITSASALDRVTVRLQTAPESELRVRFRGGDGAWERWSAWSRAPLVREVAVPAAGLERTLDFAVEQRTSAAWVGWVCFPSGGCVKIKKLNSGG